MFSLGTIDNLDDDYKQYWRVDFDMELVTGFNTIVLAYAYQTNLFPTYNSLGANKTNETALNGIVIGIALTVETVTFLWLSRRIFEGDFTEEQRFFKASLAVFISTYALRCVLLMLIIFLWSIYEGWFESMPIFAATVQSICHMVYDSVPVVYIMLRHKRIFQNEEK